MSSTVLIAALMSTLSSAPESVAETNDRISQEREATTTVVAEQRSRPRTEIVTITENPSPELAPVVTTTQEPLDDGSSSASAVVTDQDQVSYTPGNIPGVSLELEQRFDRLAQCESTGDWSINTGNGFYGGLQFTPSTWDAFGGEKYADNAHQATREQQIEIAAKVLDGQGWGAWPACTSSFGWR